MKTIRAITAHLDLSTFLLIFSVSAVIAQGYSSLVGQPNLARCLELHNQIIAGTAPSPYRYRILVPFIGQAFIRPFSAVVSTNAAFLLWYAFYDLLAVLLLLSSLFLWLREWFSKEQALIGVLFVAGTMPIALQDHYFQPWSLLESGLFTISLLAMQRRQYWLVAFLVAIASLNRETGVFIPLAFLLERIDIVGVVKARPRISGRSILLSGIFFLVWALIFFGLRLFLGSTLHVETIEGLFEHNITQDSVLHTFQNGVLFLGGFWVFVVLGFSYAPGIIRRVSVMVPFYIIVIILGGVWYEVRLLMPLYPVFIPLGLAFLYRPSEASSNAAA